MTKLARLVQTAEIMGRNEDKSFLFLGKQKEKSSMTYPTVSHSYESLHSNNNNN